MKKEKKNAATRHGTATGVSSAIAATNGRAGSPCPPPGRLKGLSLFANVGIAETYLKDVGIDIVVANEWLPERARFYQHLYSDCNMICGDIQDKKIFESVRRAA